MRNFQVLLVNLYYPHRILTSESTTKEIFHNPLHLGMAYLASVLRNHKFQVKILDADLHAIPDKTIITHVITQDYDLVGFTTTFNLVNRILKIIKDIKKSKSSVHLTLGGHTATFKTNSLFKRSKSIDSIVKHEGELTFLELADCLYQGKELIEIKGLSFRVGTRIIHNPLRPLIANLDTIPFPAFDDYQYSYENAGGYVHIISSRGCQYNCSFCSIPSFYYGKFRRRSAKNVVDEIHLIYKTFHFDNFVFYDDNFFGGRYEPFVHELCTELESRNLEIAFSVCLRPNNLTEKNRPLLEKLKSVGLKGIFLGIESGSKSDIQLYNKKVKIAQNENAIKLLRSLAIPFQFGFIMYNPFSSFSTLRENLNFLEKTKLGIDYTAFLKGLDVYPGTKLYTQLAEKNLLNTYQDARVHAIYQFFNKFDEKELFSLERKLVNLISTLHILPELIVFYLTEVKNPQLQQILLKFQTIFLKIRDKINELNCNFFREILNQIERGNSLKNLQELKKTFLDAKIKISMELFESYNEFKRVLNQVAREK
ncbi:MAG: B12-binding domain-containing radical SAM protein [Candidatus Helarchaeota archaeon]